MLWQKCDHLHLRSGCVPHVNFTSYIIAPYTITHAGLSVDTVDWQSCQNKKSQRKTQLKQVNLHNASPDFKPWSQICQGCAWTDHHVLCTALDTSAESTHHFALYGYLIVQIILRSTRLMPLLCGRLMHRAVAGDWAFWKSARFRSQSSMATWTLNYKSSLDYSSFCIATASTSPVGMRLSHCKRNLTWSAFQVKCTTMFRSCSFRRRHDTIHNLLVAASSLWPLYLIDELQ